MRNKFIHFREWFVFMVLFIGIISTSCAQDQSMFTQYMFNGLAINPAYAGSHETLSLTAHVRSQWVSFPGSPNTQSFSAHAPLRKDRVALGLQVSHNSIGVTSNTSIAPSYAFRLHFNNSAVLSMGLQVMLTNYKTNFTELDPEDKTDNAFDKDVDRWLPNFGTGVYYYTKKYYIGASMPLILKSDINTDGSKADKNSEIRYMYSLVGGYLIQASDKIVVKPNIMVSGEAGHTIFDLNTNVYFNGTIGAGLSYRWKESVAMLFEVIITDELRFGYSYDYVLGNLNSITSGSHEVMLNYRFNFTQDRVINPRYF